MRMLRTFLIALLPVTAIGLACSSDEGANNLTGPVPGQSTSTARVLLTDAPATFDSVLITFSEVSIKSDSGWAVLSSETQTHDLLSLTGGVTTVLGETELEAGSYGQIRLTITDAVVVIDGMRHTLTVPGGATSGLKIGNGFVVEEGLDIDLVLDFDAARSVVVAGNSGRFLLKPVIRLVQEGESGRIEGEVVVPVDSTVEGWTAYAFAGSDTVSSSLLKFKEVDGQLQGEFKLSFLPEGSYTVVLTDSTGAEVHSYGSVSVSAEMTTKLETQYLLGAVSGGLVGNDAENSTIIRQLAAARPWNHLALRAC
ncbi:MAG: DUF4382 domain-containing protein [Candidatus Glassbacteria bacterium]|nr:DUF4382 domain-containing protein [Candidatus Glassbacteria bacterium]